MAHVNAPAELFEIVRRSYAAHLHPICVGNKVEAVCRCFGNQPVHRARAVMHLKLKRVVVIAEVKAACRELFRNLAREGNKLAHALCGVLVYARHTADSDVFAVEKLVLIHHSVKLVEHTVKRNMCHADIHVVFIDKLRLNLGGKIAYAGNLDDVAPYAVKHFKRLFKILGGFALVSECVKLHTELRLCHGNHVPFGNGYILQCFFQYVKPSGEKTAKTL